MPQGCGPHVHAEQRQLIVCQAWCPLTILVTPSSRGGRQGPLRSSEWHVGVEPGYEVTPVTWAKNGHLPELIAIQMIGWYGYPFLPSDSPAWQRILNLRCRGLLGTRPCPGGRYVALRTDPGSGGGMKYPPARWAPGGGSALYLLSRDRVPFKGRSLALKRQL